MPTKYLNLLQEKEDKYVEAKASYNAWMEKKKDFGKDKIRDKRKEEEKKRKEEKEKFEKKKEAELVYLHFVSQRSKISLQII